MNDNQEFDYLFQKYIKGRCSREELDQLLVYLERDIFENRFEGRLEEELHMPSLYEEDEIVRNIANTAQIRIQDRIIPKTKTIRRNYTYYAVAALLAIVFGLGFYFLRMRDRDEAGIEETFSQVQDVAPGGNKAILKFSDGSPIVLDSEKGKILTVDGSIVYGDGQEVSAPKSNSLVTMSTPRGGQYQAVLPDGTKVWLNAESSIEFPVQFAKEERVVQVEGEVFFDVVHDADRPFKVKMERQQLTVKGTTFNVHAYKEEKSSYTTLLSGKVDIFTDKGKDIKLIPGQTLSNDGSKLEVLQLNTESIVAWKDGYFIFDKEPLQSVMQKISRWYDVEIAYAPGDKVEEIFGGSISRGVNLSEVLNILEITGDVKFTIEGRKIIVHKK